MEPDDLLCSRNARPEKALVGRAKGGTKQAALYREGRPGSLLDFAPRSTYVQAEIESAPLTRNCIKPRRGAKSMTPSLLVMISSLLVKSYNS